MSTPTSTKEIRQKARIDLSVAVRVEHQSRLQEFYSRNLSSGGIFLEVAGNPPAIGSKLTLNFEVPALARAFSVEAEVMHHHAFETMDEKFSRKILKHGIGLRFLSLTKRDQDLIHQYVSGKDLRVST